MDRRNFLRTGGMAVLGSLAMPSLAMPGSVRGALGGADSKSAVAAAANHFGVTEADLKKVMAVALEKGGNYADLYFEHTFNNSVSLMDGKVNNCGSNIDFGMGVRVLAGDQTGYAYVENVTLDEMLKAARTAKHMSQQALADVIGKSLNTVGLYERGLRQPSLETLCLLADTLEVSSDYLLARTDIKRTVKTSDYSESDLALRVARIENHLGL